MAERVNRRALKGKAAPRPLADHGVPLVPVPGQMELFEHSQIQHPCICGVGVRMDCKADHR